jgi:hypothetical protein
MYSNFTDIMYFLRPIDALEIFNGFKNVTHCSRDFSFLLKVTRVQIILSFSALGLLSTCTLQNNGYS